LNEKGFLKNDAGLLHAVIEEIRDHSLKRISRTKYNMEETYPNCPTTLCNLRFQEDLIPKEDKVYISLYATNPLDEGGTMGDEIMIFSEGEIH